MKPRILILHTSLDWGPKKTAENFEQLLKDKYGVRNETINQIEKGHLNNAVDRLYTFLMFKAPRVWAYLYNSRFLMAVLLALRKPAASFRYKRTLAILREFQPAIVISVSPVASGIMAYIKSKGLYRGQFLISFLDFHLHKFWIYKEADLFLCNIAEQQGWLEQIGIPREKTLVIGASVGKDFLEPIAKEEACLRLGLLTTMPTVLIACGAQIRQNMKEVFMRLLRSPKSFQVVVITARNKDLKEELEKISPPAHHPVKIMGTVESMSLYMSAADVLVGKMGRTVVEAIVKKLPMVLTGVQPGQEFKNLEYMLNHNLAPYSPHPAEVVFFVEKILNGKKIDLNKAYEKIIKPLNSKPLEDVIAEILPEVEGLKVNTYSS